MNSIIYKYINVIRIIIGCFFLIIFITDFYGIIFDSAAYEKVYISDFLGEYSCKSSLHLKLNVLADIIITFVYLSIVVFHINRRKYGKSIGIALALFDLAFITHYFFIYILFTIHDLTFLFRRFCDLPYPRKGCLYPLVFWFLTNCFIFYKMGVQ